MKTGLSGLSCSLVERNKPDEPNQPDKPNRPIVGAGLV
jgi:hypothetical protein